MISYMRGEDVERLKKHLSNYYKSTDEYLSKEYIKTIPYLTISETVELMGKLQEVIKERNEKIGELERENISLRRELEGIKEHRRIISSPTSRWS